MKLTRFAFLLAIFISAKVLAQFNPVPIANQSNAVSLHHPNAQATSLVNKRGPAASRSANAKSHKTASEQSSGSNFAPTVTYNPGGFETDFVAVADVNGDGKPDMLVASGCASNSNCPNGIVSVFLGNGDGTFQAALVYNSGGLEPRSLAVADVNGDGKPDLLVANYWGDDSLSSGSVGVLLGNGDGTYQRAVPYNTGGNVTRSIVVADVNGDGHPDVLVANVCASTCDSPNSGSVGVLLGYGDGTFQAAVTYASGGQDATSIAVADVNGDGKPDLAVTNDCPLSGSCQIGIVGLLLGNGDGTFQTAVTYNSGGNLPQWVTVADVNGDGKPDLMLANECPSTGICANGAAAVLLGNGDGTFQTAVTYSSGGQSESIAVADVNEDGIPDLVLATYCPISGTCVNGLDFGSLVAVLLGNGDGTFQTAVPYSSGGTSAFSVAAADLNGDGKPDVVIANDCVGNPNNNDCPNGVVGVLINTSIAPTATSLMSSLNPSNFGQSVTFTATVAQQFGHGLTPTGTVTFYDGTTNLGSPALNGGVATLMTSTLAVGTHSITATYNGDSSFSSSPSPVVSQVVQGAIVQLSPTSINFGNQTVGIASLAQSVTLTNIGNIALTLTSISVSASNGSSTQTNNCGTSLAAGSSCTVSVRWTPGSAGNMTGSITFTDNASNTPQTVSLSGVGVVPTVTLSPASLIFPTQVVFTTSAAQTVTLTNTGLGNLSITKVSVTGAFTQTNTCGAVNAGASCTISVKFKPTTSGTLTGSVSITDNASGSPQKITLTGTGTDVQFTPTSLNFGNQPKGTKSLPKKITLSNKASVAVSITSISLTGTNDKDFSETNTCGKSVKAGASCSITVTFTPAAKGKRTGNVSVSDNGGGSPQTVSLSGTGT